MSSYQKIYYTLLSIFIVCVVILISIFYLERADDDGKMMLVHSELVRILYQIIAVSGIGAFVTTLIDRYKNEKLKQDNLNDLRKERLENLVMSYNEIKKVRRNLRANGFKSFLESETENSDLVKDFENAMNIINTEQLIRKDQI